MYIHTYSHPVKDVKRTEVNELSDVIKGDIHDVRRNGRG